jgi:hypothetical protein
MAKEAARSRSGWRWLLRVAVWAAARPGDLILTLGAGNVYQAGDRILRRLREGA